MYRNEVEEINYLYLFVFVWPVGKDFAIARNMYQMARIQYPAYT